VLGVGCGALAMRGVCAEDVNGACDVADFASGGLQRRERVGRTAAGLVNGVGEMAEPIERWRRLSGKGTACKNRQGSDS